MTEQSREGNSKEAFDKFIADTMARIYGTNINEVEDKYGDLHPAILIYKDLGEPNDRDSGDEYFFFGCYIDYSSIKIYTNELKCIEIPFWVWDKCTEEINKLFGGKK